MDCPLEFVFKKFVVLSLPPFESVFFLLTQALNFLVEPRLFVSMDGSLTGDTHTETYVSHYAVSNRVNIVQLSTKHSPVGLVKTVLQPA